MPAPPVFDMAPGFDVRECGLERPQRLDGAPRQPALGGWDRTGQRRLTSGTTGSLRWDAGSPRKIRRWVLIKILTEVAVEGPVQARGGRGVTDIKTSGRLPKTLRRGSGDRDDRVNPARMLDLGAWMTIVRA